MTIYVVKIELNKTSTGHISASYVNLLFDWLEDCHPHLAATIPFRRPDAGDVNRVSIVQWTEMLGWVASHAENQAFPFEVASRVKPSNMGLLGYIASCSANLGEAFSRLKQFDTLIYAVNQMTIEYRDGLLILCWGQEKFRPGHWADTLAIAVLVAYTRQLTGVEIAPVEVRFINPEPANRIDFEAYFCCPVAFGMSQTEVVLRPEVLELDMRSPDSVMQRMLDEQARQLLKQLQASEKGIGRFIQALSDSIAAGDTTLAEVAKRLCTSERSLQRSLKDSGTSFRDELEKARTEIAKNLLQQGQLTLSDIAHYLSYNDQAAFSNAFKRKTGQTPARYRKSFLPNRRLDL